jgi:hypothetical protein
MLRFAIAMLAAVAVALLPPDARATESWTMVFRDDFDGTALNPDSWVIEQMNGSYDVSGGSLNLRSVPSGFPQIVSAPSLVPSAPAIRLRFGFQFGNTTCYGSAIGARVSDCVAACGCPPYYAFHRDCAIGTNVRIPSPTACSATVRALEGAAPSYHVGEITIYPDSVVAVVDGETVYAEAGGWPAPSAIWIGSVGDTCCAYTDLSVDFAEVLTLSPPAPARRKMWGELKMIYR